MWTSLPALAIVSMLALARAAHAQSAEPAPPAPADPAVTAAPAALPELPLALPPAQPRPVVIYVDPLELDRERPAPPPAPPGPRPGLGGFVLGLAAGVGAPWGGGNAVGLSEGIGTALTVGWALGPFIVIEAFGHWNRTSLALRTADEGTVRSNGGNVGLVGADVRMVMGDGRLNGWASLGMGSGGAKGEAEDEGGRTTGLEIDFDVMPIVAFGIEARVAKGLRVGPWLRWYFTSVDEVCVVQEEGTDLNRDCDSSPDTNDSVVPDMAFLGVGATWSP